MRPRGKLSDVPDRRLFKLKDDIKLDLPKDATLIKRYEVALKALIVDMRKNNSATRQISLENGQRVKLDGKENGYQFPYEEDAELFEGAAVVANIGGRQSEGHIVAIVGRQILISLSDDFGPQIQFCIVRVDNTAMLEALRTRLEKIISGEIAGFNTKLAEAVMCNEGEEALPGAIPSTIANNLNVQQRKAISLALSNEILYIWGPPGTGKTQTLSALCLTLFLGKKRILLCSNTNQAVDQVLFKLCEEFADDTEGKQAIDNGSIVRIGKIAHAQLNEKWAPYVTLDGIVERKSATLKERKKFLEEQLDGINKAFERATEIFRQFKSIDELVTRQMQYEREYDGALKGHGDVVNEKSSMIEKLHKLEDDIVRYNQAGFVKRAFMTKPEVIEKEMLSIRAVISALTNKAEITNQTVKKLKRQVNDISSAISAVQTALVGFDRKVIEKQIADADKQKQPILDEITDINKQLNDIMKAVVDKAKIVGATVTKAYLSPQIFSSFDVVIIDEASMVLLPALYHAAGLAKEKVVVSGDFMQLAPIIPTNQKAILDEIGTDVFRSAKLDSTSRETKIKRRVMLDKQYRMDDSICKLISKLMYGGGLKTGICTKDTPDPLPLPFNAPLTIVDTSPIYPFVNRDPFGSRFNLMNALAIRNLCLHFKEGEYLKDSSCLGVCSPYAAQAKVIKRIFSTEEYALAGLVEPATVHRYQGDEKTTMVLDIPDSVGEPRVGVFLEAESPSDNGAMLFNVAVSRAKSHLIVFANLNYLDRKLPSYSIVRDILYNMQSGGAVIDVRDVLALYPIMNDLRKYGSPFDLSSEAQKTGLFGQADFDMVCQADMERARKGIAIFSGFVTPQRTGSYESLFRTKVADGIAIRCVTRPPDRNGSIPFDQGKDALDGLEQMGCVVDTRGDIHEKVVIIDDEIVWFGSLNPLSHTSKTAEVMARIEGKQVAMQLAAFMALDKGVRDDSSLGLLYRAENPRCPICGSRTSYNKGRYGAYWKSEGCPWTGSCDKSKNGRGQKAGSETRETGSSCPKCGKPLVQRMGKFGPFDGCSGYPDCKYIEKKKTGGKTKHTKKKGGS
jgi:DNA polymerase III delta prime subunit